MKRAISVLLYLVIAMFPISLYAEGRYEAVVIPQANGSGQGTSLQPKVFILDTEEGHLWTWSENEVIYGELDKPQFGSVLIYQGRVRPGERMGEIIEKNLGRR